MKIRLLSLLLVTTLAVSVMSGCGKLKAAGQAAERGAESVGDALADAMSTPTLTAKEAESVALKHAGFTADEVTALRTEYELDDGIPKYDVEFRHGAWKYDYEIHADTGQILSYEKDN